jgi:hypothetical protein
LSDSTYSRDCGYLFTSNHDSHITLYLIGFEKWIFNWELKDWKTSKGEPVKNQGIIRYISAQMNWRSVRRQKVILQYVKAHCGIEGNEGADKLANIGATKPQEPECDWVAKRVGILEDMEPTDESGEVTSSDQTPTQSTVIASTPNPNKTRKTFIEPENPRTSTSKSPVKQVIDIDDIPEPPESPRKAGGRRKPLPSASERHAKAQFEALKIYPLRPEEIESKKAAAGRNHLAQVSPQNTTPKVELSRGISTHAISGNAANLPADRPIPRSSMAREDELVKGIDANELDVSHIH